MDEMSLGKIIGFVLFRHTQYCWSNNLAGGGSLSNTLHGFQCWSGYLILLKRKSLQKRVLLRSYAS
jgi:hypothetical protein